MEVVIFHNNNETPYEDIVRVVRDAFSERINEGLFFSCANFSVNDYVDRTHNSYIFCAKVNSEIVGTVSMTVRNQRGLTYGVHEYLAVSSSMKHSGIASLLFKELHKLACSLNLDFIISDTAVEATSSVCYHKKMGFKIMRLQSFPLTNYYSYGFVYPLRKMRVFNVSLFRIPFFLMSSLITIIRYKKNGESRF